MTDKKVIIMRGLPGSGKTEYVKRNFSDAVICSADHFFYKLGNGVYSFDQSKIGEAHKECFNNFMTALMCDYKLIVIDNTNAKRHEVTPYIACSIFYGYDYEVIDVSTPVDKCLSRQRHNVPQEHVEGMSKWFEKPLPYWNKKSVKGF